jgi:hypothetical protein
MNSKNEIILYQTGELAIQIEVGQISIKSI